jgi:hypothetical protein
MKQNIKGVSACGGVWYYTAKEAAFWMIKAVIWWIIIFISIGLIFLHLPLLYLFPIVFIRSINQVNN